MLRDAEFEAIRAYLYEETGIALGGAKRDMVSARLAKRLRHLGLGSFGAYMSRVRADDPAGERQQFINCLTTNKTDFFREPHHFAFLRDTVVPRLRAAGKKRLRVWSAGCSTGEEPYTLAMTLAEACPAAAGWDVKILASDIDTAVLAGAARGVYDADRVSDVPRDLLHRYFLRGTGARAGQVAVRPELRERIVFRRVNLIEEPWPIRTRLDAIFCRNVVIYFDRETQHRLLTRFAAQLDPSGYLFMGHSENVHWMADTFAPLGATVYRPRPAPDAPAPAAPVPAAAERPAAPVRTAERAEEEHAIVLGDVQATRGPALLKTLLGSCVSVCIFDPETGVGGMNHFSLPGVSDEGVSARYGAHAIELLITAVMKQGADRARLRAKVFGGANVLNSVSERLDVGARNAEFVLKHLGAEGVPVVGHSLGGTRGLIVWFRPHTGQAQVKPLAGRDLHPVVEREKQFGRELLRRVERFECGAAPPGHGATLF